MNNLLDIIYVPIAWVLRLLYLLTSNYGVAIILFAVVAKVLMLPAGIKNERNRLRMQAIQPKMKALAEKYGNNNRDPRYQQELQELYTKENYSPFAGCLPQLIQLPLIFGMWNAVRRPLTYLCDVTANQLLEVVNTLKNAGVESITGMLQNVSAENTLKIAQTNEMIVADAINQNWDKVSGLLPEGFQGINIDFFGINLGLNPELTSWSVIVPILCCLTSFLTSFITMRINRPPNADKNDPTQKSMNTMMVIMPLFSLWIGFSMSFGVALYWIASNLLSMLQAALLPRFIKAPVDPAVARREARKKEPKKLNYNQIQKMERLGLSPEEHEQSRKEPETENPDKEQE